MKISKMAVMILGVGVMIVVGVALYLAYSQYASQRDTLFQSIDAANKKYAQVSTEKRTLEPQLAQLQQQLQTLKDDFARAKGEFPNVTIQSIEYDEEMKKLADDADVNILKLAATDNVEQREGNVTYTVTQFTAMVGGERVNLLDFLHRVATSRYLATAGVDNLNLEDAVLPTPSPTSGAPEIPAPLHYATLTFTYSVYRYQGE